jgi:hypothetical protein
VTLVASASRGCLISGIICTPRIEIGFVFFRMPSCGGEFD